MHGKVSLVTIKRGETACKTSKLSGRKTMKGGGNKIQTEDKRICILAMFSRVKKLKINQIANRRIDRLIMLYVLNIPYNNGNK